MKKIGLLTIAFLTLLGLVYYFEFVRTEQEASRATNESSLLPLSGAPVTEIEIQTKSASLQLARSGEGWHLRSPIEAPADSSKADELIASLRNARRDRVLSSAGLDLAEYGLDDPDAVVAIGIDGKSILIRMGKLTYNGRQVYVQVEGESDVILTTEHVLENVQGDLFSWRDKELLAFNQPAVSRIRIAGSETIVLERGNGAWQLVQPLAETADEGAVSGLLSAINFARIARFLSESQDSLEAFGLDPPAVELELEQGGAEQFRLAVGRKDGLDFAATSSQRKSVFAVRTSLVDKLSQRAAAYRDRRVVRLPEAEIRRLEYRNGSLEISIDRSGSDWLVQTPESHRGIAAVEGVFLLPVSAMRYTTLTEPPRSVQRAFESPRFVLGYELTSGHRAQFEFVESGGKYWAREAGSARSGEISAVDWGRLAWDADRVTSTQ